MGISPGSLAWNVPPQVGDDARKQRDLERTQREQASARSAAATQIGAGGLLVNNGGSITIQGTGAFNTNGAINTTGSMSASTTITAGTTISAGSTISTPGTVSGGAISTGGTVSAGTVSSSGAVSGSTGTFPSGLSSLDVRSRVLTSGFANQYVDGSGQMGIVPSGIQYKQDIEPADTAAIVEALRTVALVRFRYIQAVEELGDAAPYLLGSIAQYFDAAGLSEWVTLDADGEPDGIAWERLTIPLLAAFQSHDQRIAALEAR
jgi:hypothetical protein